MRLPLEGCRGCGGGEEEEEEGEGEEGEERTKEEGGGGGSYMSIHGSTEEGMLHL